MSGLVTPLAASPMPRRLLLLRTEVAGLYYYDAGLLPAAKMVPNTPLILRREPENSHDDLAIEVFLQSKDKLGYVPRRDNQAVARLMDAGVPMVAEITWSQCPDCFGMGINIYANFKSL